MFWHDKTRLLRDQRTYWRNKYLAMSETGKRLLASSESLEMDLDILREANHQLETENAALKATQHRKPHQEIIYDGSRIHLGADYMVVRCDDWDRLNGKDVE